MADGHFDHFELQNNDDVMNDHVNASYFQESDLQRKLQSDIRRYKRVGVGVGLLCAVLALLVIAVPLYLYHSNMVEREQLARNSILTEEQQARINNLTKERDQLQTRFDQLMTSHKNLTKERDCRRLCEPHGFAFGDGLCYYVSTGKKTWDQSRQWCRDRQSDLIVIKSKEKQDFVERVNKRVWLGLTDRDRDGSFQWVDGTPLTTPTYWYPSAPHNQTSDDDCVEFYDGSQPTTPKRGWNDISCSGHAINWICERVLC